MFPNDPNFIGVRQYVSDKYTGRVSVFRNKEGQLYAITTGRNHIYLEEFEEGKVRPVGEMPEPITENVNL